MGGEFSGAMHPRKQQRITSIRLNAVCGSADWRNGNVRVQAPLRAVPEMPWHRTRWR
jgi:hypothetical protein